ncbi:MAG: esterase-like activity of phytase family protein [Bdellovibrio sp.]|nr:esterase-like activity of phytase family protein [Bdellovibrio sp.]
MEKLVFFTLILLSFGFSFAGNGSDAPVTGVQALKKWSLPYDFKVEKKRVGGLSGCSMFEDHLYFVSDSRGAEGGPRIYVISFNSLKPEIDFSKASVISVKTDSENKILDLEGIAVFDKDQIFLSSEGDLNQKPRQNPSLFWINTKGVKTKSVTMPEDYLPEKSGKQTKGVQNNLVFEGLSVDFELKKWAAMLEGPLVQDRASLKLVESALDSTKFDKIYNYPTPVPYSSNPDAMPGLNAYYGISDILFLNSESFLTLERGVQFGRGGMGFHTQLCEAVKTKTSNELSRSCFYSMNDDESLKTDIPSGANFEGLCWVDKQKKKFIVVSDNNFSKSEKTVFILYQLN